MLRQTALVILSCVALAGCNEGAPPLAPESTSADVVRDVRQNPSTYYVDIHNSTFPAGALRGQLGD